MRSNRIRTTTFAATALLAALSLTACGSENGTSESAKAGSAAPAAHQAAHQAVKESRPPAATAAPEEKTTGTVSTPDNTTAPVRSDAKNTTDATKRTGSGSATKPDRTPVTCDGGNTRTAVTTVSRPLNHLLLTLTNTGDRTCYAYYAPGLRFDDAQAAFPVLDDSKPQAVVTLDPGQSAYAGIGLTGEPGAGPSPREATRLQVHFSARSGEGSTGTPVSLTLPSDTYWDDNGFVTYWQTEMADALTY
ncbi:DUF4232 domain-containing protein [Streptomyces poriferorum]|uniref:DUF4232 domain-containing protein n=1 Tax=Streptomyces poriferorum TaxID=2798799 RepID=A0ABY9ITN1_9ACTN|nr:MULTISPECIES: DUF4232 domain-containing protein [unclassified Streptomyces]MDP5312811.1 DUF4232 domain-containing protein [Streptomyces sp. Alt4]WLQ58174.1 DUF4232 domain-containing protein [Streptomyces sp. Alt2]